MALMTCPECEGKVSSKAIICPHCGYPMQDKPIPTKPTKKGKRRRPNGSGTIVKLSGNRRKPYQVRVNTRLDDRGYPAFDILDNFPDRVQAEIALAKYNETPYDVNLRGLTFTEVYEKWYMRKYGKDPNKKQKGQRSSAEYASRAALKKCAPLHDKVYSKLRTQEMQKIVDCPDYSHSMTEHISSLLRNMGKYALEFDITSKDYASFIVINKEDDTEKGVPFTEDELALLWKNKDRPLVDTILIYCYSGWRLNELARMPLKDIDLENKVFNGGLKTPAGKNRIVPIHSAIYGFVRARYNLCFKSLIYHDGNVNIGEGKYREYFAQALLDCGITTEHTPHDCRHTFNSKLDSSGVNLSCRLKLMGHAGGNINEKVYTHKTIDELREAVEMIKVP